MLDGSSARWYAPSAAGAVGVISPDLSTRMAFVPCTGITAVAGCGLASQTTVTRWPGRCRITMFTAAGHTNW